MKVSKQVEDSVQEAITSLRNALAFAARSEEPYIAKHIADKIMELDGLIKVNQLLAVSYTHLTLPTKRIV